MVSLSTINIASMLSKTITILLALVFPCLKEDIVDQPVKRIEPTLKQKEGNDDEILQVVRGCSAVVRDLCDATRP